MAYFTFISAEYSCNNKLYKAILAFLQTNNRMIIPDGSLEVFKKSIIEKIEAINKEYPRCKPIRPTWDGWLPKKGDAKLSLGYGSICTFNIYQAK